MSAYAHRALTKSHLPSLPSLPVRPWASFARLAAVFRLWRRRVREREALARLSDRELADFGATTADVYRELNSPFWRSLPPC